MSATTESVLLRLDDISLSFKGVKAITSISFAVKTGEICGLIGPNGAGKSSLLNVINGVYQAQSGSVSYAGQTRRRMRRIRLPSAALRGPFKTSRCSRA